MFKKISAFVAALLLTAVAFAAVDVNKGTAAELDGVKGLGPAKSKLILDERKKGEFKSWDDLISRVKGMGEKSAAKLSAEGLTVGGASYKAAAAKTEAKADAKADTKADAKADAKAAKPAATPAAAAAPVATVATTTAAAKPAAAASAAKK